MTRSSTRDKVAGNLVEPGHAAQRHAALQLIVQMIEADRIRAEAIPGATVADAEFSSSALIYTR